MLQQQKYRIQISERCLTDWSIGSNNDKNIKQKWHDSKHDKNTKKQICTYKNVAYARYRNGQLNAE